MPKLHWVTLIVSVPALSPSRENKAIVCPKNTGGCMEEDIMFWWRNCICLDRLFLPFIIILYYCNNVFIYSRNWVFQIEIFLQNPCSKLRTHYKLFVVKDKCCVELSTGFTEVIGHRHQSGPAHCITFFKQTVNQPKCSSTVPANLKTLHSSKVTSLQ